MIIKLTVIFYVILRILMLLLI